MVDEGEQVAASAAAAGADGLDSENILCDIIAQQREFQLRQELRAAAAELSQQASSISGELANAKLHNDKNSSGSGSSKQRPLGVSMKLQRKQQSIGGLDQTAEAQFEHLVALNNNNEKPQAAGKGQRRKFSLSYAMSNLAPFAGSSASGSASSAAATPPPKQVAAGRKSMLHRGSLASSELDELAAGECSLKQQPQTQPRPARGLGDKKKSFVHKAIRRGSKLFDSMLLSSAQQQAAAAAAAASSAAHELSGSSGESLAGRQNDGDHPHLPQATSGCGGPRVQFAADCEPSGAGAGDELDESTGADEPQKPPRRRRLRLGSIPHDLRRVLSLSGAANQSAQANNENLIPANGGQHNNNKLAGSLANLQPAALASSSGATTTSPAAARGAQVKEPASGRLKRKNSLFAPLTSAASSAFYHAHAHNHHQNSSSNNSNTNQSNNQQQTRGASCLAPAEQQAAAGSQSASFSLCQDHSRTYKLIIFGSSAVGKTSIIQRFLYGHFPVAHKPTVEELHSNKYNIPELGEIYLEILDTSGTFEFPAMRRLSIEKGDAFILVYSVADAASWQEVIQLRQLILDEKGDERLPPPPVPATQSPLEPPVAPSRSQRPQSASANPRPGASPNQQQPQQQEQEPISSIYAAATRLATAQRRTSSSPMLECQAAAAAASSSSAATPQACPTRPIAHYNSQLSRLLQQTPASATGGPMGSRGSLLQSMSIEDAPETGEMDSAGAGKDDAAQTAAAGATAARRPLAGLMGTGKRQVNLASNPSPPPQQQHLASAAPRKRRTPIVVVANKCDLDTDSFQVTQEEAERLVCEQWGNSFVNCSAKEALNIDRVFKELLRQARAPDILSQFVIDDHQQRRRSLPVLKNQLGAHHLKGLRHLHSQQQQLALAAHKQAASAGQQQHEPRSMSSASDDSQCVVM